MLTPRQLAALRAALTYWTEELGPHGPVPMRPYWPDPRARPLSRAELEALQEVLRDSRLRYAVVDPQSGRVLGTQLYATPAAARRSAARRRAARRSTARRRVTRRSTATRPIVAAVLSQPTRQARR